jgi:hypothetical protein
MTTNDDCCQTLTCCHCGGTLGLMGDLGHLRWYRCMDCGMDQSVERGRCWAVTTNNVEPPQWIAGLDTPLADLAQHVIDAPQCEDCGCSSYVIEIEQQRPVIARAVAVCSRCGRRYHVIKAFEDDCQGR